MREEISVAVHERTSPPAGQVVFVQSVAESCKWSLNAAPVAPSSLSIIRNSEEQTVGFTTASDILIVSIDEKLLDDGDAPRMTSTTAQKSDTFAFCASWILSVLAQVGSMDGVAVTELAMVLPGMITDRLQYVQGQLRQGSCLADAPRNGDLELFRKARDIADAEQVGDLTIATLAARLGVPASILRDAFVRVVGVGPANWLRSRRLGGARRDLLDAARTGATVTDIATKWGFWHLGRFASNYAEYFGEYPSRTVRTAQDAVRPD
ncbi:helix-turn-helix domain-containing protein [Chthonobacter albigriseus]|uniref:helix-turn-helix domain-containing protein n=1 Tax=Chthonobacter albigriseus TaxID=1683161 RepID=UPI0015EF6A67|nr:helix-turn-helix domain-containing protein [Chthonobacter albigriseus]